MSGWSDSSGTVHGKSGMLETEEWMRKKTEVPSGNEGVCRPGRRKKERERSSVFVTGGKKGSRRGGRERERMRQDFTECCSCSYHIKAGTATEKESESERRRERDGQTERQTGGKTGKRTDRHTERGEEKREGFDRRRKIH